MELKNKINLTLFVFLLLSVSLIVFIIIPLYKDIKNVTQELISKKQEMLSLENKIKNIEEFRKKYPEIKLKLTTIDTLFTNPETAIDFITFLEDTSKNCQLEMKISPFVVVKNEEDPWPSISFQINSIGSFPNLLKFIEKLESCPYLIEFRGLSISRLSETELELKEYKNFSLGDVRATLSIKVFTK